MFPFFLSLEGLYYYVKDQLWKIDWPTYLLDWIGPWLAGFHFDRIDDDSLEDASKANEVVLTALRRDDDEWIGDA